MEFDILLTEVFFSSLISTPPPERVPIRTHLSAYSEEKVLSAIKFELDRGGQVFYVLPRIKGNCYYWITFTYIFHKLKAQGTWDVCLVRLWSDIEVERNAYAPQ